jgi:hypothetical protein
MTLEEIKKEIFRSADALTGPRNLSLTEIERHKSRIIAFRALADIMMYERKYNDKPMAETSRPNNPEEA